MRMIRRLGLRMASWLFRHCRKPVQKTEKLDEVTSFARLLFATGGGCMYTCVCGRVYFGGDYDFEEGEYEHLQADPEATEIQDGPYVWNLPQSVYVNECPCNTLQVYERFIWDYREPIADYLKARSLHELGRHQELVGNLDQVTNG